MKKAPCGFAAALWVFCFDEPALQAEKNISEKKDYGPAGHFGAVIRYGGRFTT